jgi:hypothetical protein
MLNIRMLVSVRLESACKHAIQILGFRQLRFTDPYYIIRVIKFLDCSKK